MDFTTRLFGGNTYPILFHRTINITPVAENYLLTDDDGDDQGEMTLKGKFSQRREPKSYYMMGVQRKASKRVVYVVMEFL